MKYIIFDIDGVLADCSHRLKYIKGEKKDYEKFTLMMSCGKMKSYQQEFGCSASSTNGFDKEENITRFLF